MDVITTNINGSNTSKGIEDRFAAAVNVIRGLPKNGKYNFISVKLLKRLNNTKVNDTLDFDMFRKNTNTEIYIPSTFRTKEFLAVNLEQLLHG